MYSHTLTFDSILQKQIAIEWILMNIMDCRGTNKYVKEATYTFYTNTALSKRKHKKLLQKTQALSYIVRELYSISVPSDY